MPDGGDQLLADGIPDNGHFAYMHNVISRLLKVGYQPIIAHIERYMCLTMDIGRVQMLKDLGALIQINAGSVLGNRELQRKGFATRS